MDFLHLEQQLRQELHLTPEMLQSLSVLQMNAEELQDFLNRSLEENPVLEAEDSARREREAAELLQRFRWLDSRAVSPGASLAAMDPAQEPGAPARELESLFFFLRDQLQRLRLPRPLEALTEYLARLLDENGYLDPEDLEDLLDRRIPEELLEQAVETLQSLEPAGVGARSLGECLLLQLRRRQPPQPLAEKICLEHLSALGERRYRAIAHSLRVTEAEVEQAARLIAGLDPKPGRSFSGSELNLYVRPDVLVLREGDSLQVLINDYYLPRLSLSKTYAQFYESSEDEEVHAYLQKKIQQAKWLMDSLARRGNTLRRCVETILELQRPFFLGTQEELAPMTLSLLADRLDLHVSTVSRALRGKVLQCWRGSYPIQKLFSRSPGDQDISSQAIRRRICQLVSGEDKTRPYSDEKLRERLLAEGIYIARRTVAQYRVSCGIPASTARRERDSDGKRK